MTDQTCDCGQPTRDQAYTCDTCLNTYNRALAETPWLDGELETSIAKLRGIDYRGLGGSASSEAPAPVHIPALEARRVLKGALSSAVRFCREENIRHQSVSDRLPVESLPSMSRWLMWRVDGLAFNDMGGHIADTVVTAFRAARRTIDNRPERRYSGPCECGRDLYHKPGATETTCRNGCGRTYTVGELYAWMQGQVRGRLVTAREGATLLCRFDMETQQGTIDKWHERGRLVDHGRDAQARRLYLFDDLLTLATKSLGVG